jgi:hypothetical protein
VLGLYFFKVEIYYNTYIFMSNELLSGLFQNSMTGFFYMIAIVLFVIFLLWLIMAVSLWRIFTKAGKPGWAAIIPYYGYYVQVQVARLPVWYFIPMCLPLLLAIAQIKLPSQSGSLLSLFVFGFYAYVVYKMAQQFGKGIGYTLGLLFIPFIFYPMLAFGDSAYQQEQAAGSQDDLVPPQQNEAPAENQAASEVVEVASPVIDVTAPTEVAQEVMPVAPTETPVMTQEDQKPQASPNV